ncbi:MAG: hypothetical protein WDN30_11170 [Pararobbsia sp.]
MKKAASKTRTPVRLALVKDSALLPSVRDGLAAIETAHSRLFDDSIRSTFADSLDLDKAMQQGHEQENRRDYLLGHAPSGAVVAVEPRSARHDEITTVIRKRVAARNHLDGHLNKGANVQKWLWVASDKVHFADTEKARLLLSQNGIEFAGKKITAKHLPASSSTAVSRRRGKG